MQMQMRLETDRKSEASKFLELAERALRRRGNLGRVSPAFVQRHEGSFFFFFL